MSENGARHHTEGGRDDSETGRLDRGELGDEDSPTEITDLCTNGKGENKRGFHAGPFPTDPPDVQRSTSYVVANPVCTWGGGQENMKGSRQKAVYRLVPAPQSGTPEYTLAFDLILRR